GCDFVTFNDELRVFGLCFAAFQSGVLNDRRQIQRRKLRLSHIINKEDARLGIRLGCLGLARVGIRLGCLGLAGSGAGLTRAYGGDARTDDAYGMLCGRRGVRTRDGMLDLASRAYRLCDGAGRTGLRRDVRMDGARLRGRAGWDLGKLKRAWLDLGALEPSWAGTARPGLELPASSSSENGQMAGKRRLCRKIVKVAEFLVCVDNGVLVPEFGPVVDEKSTTRLPLTSSAPPVRRLPQPGLTSSLSATFGFTRSLLPHLRPTARGPDQRLLCSDYC
ncbi:heat shock protein Hsp20, partial [Striga asiatica]